MLPPLESVEIKTEGPVFHIGIRIPAGRDVTHPDHVFHTYCRKSRLCL